MWASGYLLAVPVLSLADVENLWESGRRWNRMLRWANIFLALAVAGAGLALVLFA